MNRRAVIQSGLARTALGVAGLAAVLGAAVAMTIETAALAAPVSGKLAPDFTATGSDGKTHSLRDYRGKTVVLEWTNHQCPYVEKHYQTGNMQALQRDATGQGVVWLSVISSAPGTQGHVSPAEANRLTSSRKAAPTAVLLDPKGVIGRLYDARNTPHMYVISTEGVLVYQGAIDDRPTYRHSDVNGASNYVRGALAALAAGQPVKPAVTRAYGCTVKYE
jgi:peroxiredoxin